MTPAQQLYHEDTGRYPIHPNHPDYVKWLEHKALDYDHYQKAHDDNIDAMRQDMLIRIYDLEKQIKKQREQIAYWSYCTWNGMLRGCPEKRNQFLDWMKELDIPPYNFKDTDKGL